MIKLKISKSITKRFKKLKNGKFKHKQSHLKHILTKKSAKRKRHLRNLKFVDKSHIKTLKEALQNY
ncbi:MAG TPA: 50S ribosomal protein L35 [Candidatus Azoamicus sp. OHIO2]